MIKEEKLTSVKITQPLYTKFKVSCLENNFSFKKLADRAIFLYLTDNELRKDYKKRRCLEEIETPERNRCFLMW